jgi:RNA polymerase primary sigma factor
MEFNHINFANTLENLKETARLQENMLTSEQVREAFSEWNLNDEQIDLINNYFKNNKIGIDEPGDTNDNLTDEDVNFLEMYLNDLKELPPVSDGEKRAVMMSALAGDNDAKAKLVEIYLPQVVEISKLYAGQGALVEDLIGEGNVAVASAVTMLDCVEGIDEVDGFIAKMIMDAMEEYIGDDTENRQADENVLEKVNLINDKAHELYECFMRKVTVKEVADELKISEDEVIEAIKFSVNHIEYIDYNEGDN